MADKLHRKKIRLLRTAGTAEGISFLVLLLVAMPLKYYMNQPLAVTVVGWLHGILFVLFVSLAWEVKSQRALPFSWFMLAFLAALVPTGTFLFDRKIREQLNPAA